jgi:hypothetical protein
MASAQTHHTTRWSPAAMVSYLYIRLDAIALTLECLSPEARSFLEPLSEVVRSGVNVLVWAGDLDWICNWYGSQLVVNSINYTDSAAFRSAKLQEYTVNGKSHGQFKTAGNLNFLRVYEAGHEVPYYRKFLASAPKISRRIGKTRRRNRLTMCPDRTRCCATSFHADYARQSTFVNLTQILWHGESTR